MGVKAGVRAPAREAKSALLCVSSRDGGLLRRMWLGPPPERSSMAARAQAELLEGKWARPGGEVELAGIERRLGRNARCEAALEKAAALGSERMVEVLIGRVSPGAERAPAAKEAARAKSLGCVRLLIAGAPREPGLFQEALIAAVKVNASLIVKELAQAIDAGGRASGALRMAAMLGHWASAEELLAFSDPSAANCEALRYAVSHKERSWVTRLALLCPKEEALSIARIAERQGYGPEAKAIAGAWSAKEEKDALESELAPVKGAAGGPRL